MIHTLKHWKKNFFLAVLYLQNTWSCFARKLLNADRVVNLVCDRTHIPAASHPQQLTDDVGVEGLFVQKRDQVGVVVFVEDSVVIVVGVNEENVFTVVMVEFVADVLLDLGNAFASACSFFEEATGLGPCDAVWNVSILYVLENVRIRLGEPVVVEKDDVVEVAQAHVLRICLRRETFRAATREVAYLNVDLVHILVAGRLQSSLAVIPRLGPLGVTGIGDFTEAVDEGTLSAAGLSSGKAAIA